MKWISLGIIFTTNRSKLMVLFDFIKKQWRIITLCIVFGLLGMVASLIMAEGVHATSDADFCMGCHVMEPMVAAYREDIHGGKNSHGIQAVCTDCHLPHESVTGYLIAKIKTSSNDIWCNFVLGTDDIDWEERRSHRSRFVYDSGCLSCHHELEEATQSNMKAFLPHRDYFLEKEGKSDMTCVSCHENVGHKNLGHHLIKQEGQQYE